MEPILHPKSSRDITGNYVSTEDTLGVGDFDGISLSGNQVLKDGTPIATLNTTSTGLYFFALPGAPKRRCRRW